MNKIKELLDDIIKVRNDLVAQSNPHFQDLTNIIYKWENKLTTKQKLVVVEGLQQDFVLVGIY